MMTEEHFSALFAGLTHKKPQKIEEKKKEHEEDPEEYNDTDSAGSLDGEEILAGLHNW